MSSYQNAARSLGGLNPPSNIGLGNTEHKISGTSQETFTFHGEALARDTWGERYGFWIVLCFTMAFALFLIVMVLLGNVPGKSFPLKSISDILQFVGEFIGLFFCVRIALRLRKVTLQLKYELAQKEAWKHSPNEAAQARAAYQSARRAFLAWTFLSIAITFYASGQVAWTSYDVRMNSAEVPFPGIYDIGFVGSYPFFLLGTLLLTRRNRAAVGRVRLLLDALAVIGAALAISWFFLLNPLIEGLSQQPSQGAAFLSVYFPTGDLFLVAVGALLMFSPLSNRDQQSVFMRLCLGLFCLAVTDSLLAYYSLSFSFNTGTLQDVLWPLSMALIGLAAIEYPLSIARGQVQQASSLNARPNVTSLISRNQNSQTTAIAQAIAPFILILLTSALLLTVVAPRGGLLLVQADMAALGLVLIIIVRQALTLIENNRLTMQMRGELVISRRELQVTKREADEATRSAQEKRVLEEGIALLREVHARVARGDIAARAPTVPGPLLPIAISLNLMLDRLSSLSERGSRYDRLVQDCRALQLAIERLGQGQPVLANNQPPVNHPELRALFLGLSHLQRAQDSQQRRQGTSITTLNNLIRRFRESIYEVRRSPLFKDTSQVNFERMLLDRVIRELELMEQQMQNLLGKGAANHILTPVQITLPQSHQIASPVPQNKGEQPNNVSQRLHNPYQRIRNTQEEH
ncbi:hypothetical protein [Ktedonospora formicarum]|uniref:Uncharacterized protein n=1 Tax=Ktedonospora formicarum TaxID=2778364 RepID=A0A8J3I414_9CHLR|nr:hypothetical protein [Ktedonospora formicarum]GHO46463.1 hypothetical protein KSX_46260 [Ktedonospora formicarum]